MTDRSTTKLPQWLIEKRDETCLRHYSQYDNFHEKSGIDMRQWKLDKANTWKMGFNAAAELLLESNEFVRNTNKLSLWNNLTLVKKLVIATEALEKTRGAMKYAYEDHVDQYYMNVLDDINEALNKINEKDKI